MMMFTGFRLLVIAIAIQIVPLLVYADGWVVSSGDAGLWEGLYDDAVTVPAEGVSPGYPYVMYSGPFRQGDHWARLEIGMDGPTTGFIRCHGTSNHIYTAFQVSIDGENAIWETKYDYTYQPNLSEVHTVYIRMSYNYSYSTSYVGQWKPIKFAASPLNENPNYTYVKKPKSVNVGYQSTSSDVNTMLIQYYDTENKQWITVDSLPTNPHYGSSGSSRTEYNYNWDGSGEVPYNALNWRAVVVSADNMVVARTYATATTETVSCDFDLEQQAELNGLSGIPWQSSDATDAFNGIYGGTSGTGSAALAYTQAGAGWLWDSASGSYNWSNEYHTVNGPEIEDTTASDELTALNAIVTTSKASLNVDTQVLDILKDIEENTSESSGGEGGTTVVDVDMTGVEERLDEIIDTMGEMPTSEEIASVDAAKTNAEQEAAAIKDELASGGDLAPSSGFDSLDPGTLDIPALSNWDKKVTIDGGAWFGNMVIDLSRFDWVINIIRELFKWLVYVMFFIAYLRLLRSAFV
ncbi:MAG: hypothetical protein JW942_07840 [Opitutales bacterium]|nr:hypothetical protein [Opitutales bacterium]